MQRNEYAVSGPPRKLTLLGVANGKSETRRDAETGILKSESETKKWSNFMEKQICDRQKQNLRLRDPLVGCTRFRHLGRTCRDSSFFIEPFTPLLLGKCFLNNV